MYKEDFGGNEETILRFIFRYNINDSDLDDESIIREVTVRKNMILRYE